MLSTSPAACCPACSGSDLTVLGRWQADPVIASHGDLEVYGCRDCGAEFDNEVCTRVPAASTGP